MVPSGKVAMKAKSMPSDDAKPRNPYAIDDPRIYTGQIGRLAAVGFLTR
jgi:hypothetical protein